MTADSPRDDKECPVPDCRAGWVPFQGGQIPCQSCDILAEIERRAREADWISHTWSWMASPPEVLALVKDRNDWIARHGTIDELRIRAEAQVRRVEAVLADHWDWKAGRSLHAAVSAALRGVDGPRAYGGNPLRTPESEDME